MKLEMTPLWQPVLDFWFADGLEKGWPSGDMNSLWFGGSRGLDAEISERFAELVEAARWNELVDWEAQPLSRLALVILLDQFTRNIHRGQPEAFSGDHRACTLVMEGMARGFDDALPWIGRVFFYMPLMHAEELSLQDECVAHFEKLVRQAPEEISAKIANNLVHAREHRDIIARFGRFPHRNQVLGRASTPEEEAFLETAKRYGQ